VFVPYHPCGQVINDSQRVLDEHTRTGTHHSGLSEDILLLIPFRRKGKMVRHQPGVSFHLRGLLVLYKESSTVTYLSTLGSDLSRTGTEIDMIGRCMIWYNLRLQVGCSGQGTGVSIEFRAPRYYSFRVTELSERGCPVNLHRVITRNVSTTKGKERKRV